MTIRDRRYSVRLEWCGYSKARFVVRFCGEWVGQAAKKREANNIARQHQGKRLP